VTPPERINTQPRMALPYEVAIIYSAQTFTFESGHRMRTAKCLVCNLVIGESAVAVFGVAALDGAPCTCGGIVSDVFLIHTDCTPVTRTALQAAITRSLECDLRHDQP
jgi:hypothetical protein